MVRGEGRNIQCAGVRAQQYAGTALDVFLERMGLTGHQTVYGLHYDTDNYHLHIAVNRMNPDSGKVVQPHRGFDIREAHKA